MLENRFLLFAESFTQESDKILADLLLKLRYSPANWERFSPAYEPRSSLSYNRAKNIVLRVCNKEGYLCLDM